MSDDEILTLTVYIDLLPDGGLEWIYSYPCDNKRVAALINKMDSMLMNIEE